MRQTESEVLTLTSSEAGMIERAVVQASRAAVQEGLSLTQLTPQPLDASISANTAMHLPKLQLPSFDGNILKRPEFWEHMWTNKILPKFGYLKLALRGAAFTAISGIVLTNDNYDVAVALLKQKFGRLDSIVKMLYSKL